ncbi:hypothetical protein [Niabella drilacis]|uniref:Copper chaperone NosL n=1 Tax=Niabella drilacis (strain DSM 25811 / CCM 8410 / CCUG 62505 / LMG 26954 / E90) TaxID=1285928 RepID=A0A1G6PNU7_NIADE|nr:hypothetical protein [Niabella drilacis]SDC81186.1 hypothetical protein SAMN04487894_10488 [Niabella drilacis]
MRSLFSLVLVVLLLTQCKKAGDAGPSNAFAGDSYCANCSSVRFHITLSDKNTGDSYIVAQRISGSDIEIRNALNQLIGSSNISVTFPDDLKGVIVFPMPDRSRFFLKIKTNILMDVSYTSKLNNSGQYEISNLKVKDHTASLQKIADGYLIKIDL